LLALNLSRNCRFFSVTNVRYQLLVLHLNLRLSAGNILLSYWLLTNKLRNTITSTKCACKSFWFWINLSLVKVLPAFLCFFNVYTNIYNLRWSKPCISCHYFSCKLSARRTHYILKSFDCNMVCFAYWDEVLHPHVLKNLVHYVWVL
jgi:hypothetical protein